LGLIGLAIGGPKAWAQAPSIEITSVPAYGSAGSLRGRVRFADPASYRVAAYLFVEGLGWYVKPTAAAPCTTIGPNGEFEVNVTTGGYDHLAHRYAVFLVPVGEACQPACPPATVCNVSQCPPTFLPDGLAPWLSDFAERRPSVVRFSGYDWVRRDSPYSGGPESNCFVPEHAFVDQQGLHLVQEAVPNVGFCGGEVSLARSLGFGEYRIQTVGLVGQLHPETVFGMFTWDPDAKPVHRELDVELSRWGVASDTNNAQFVVQPYCDNLHRFPLEQPGPAELTFLMRWMPGEVRFSAYHGHHLGTPPPGDLIQERTFTAGVPTPGKERFRFNLWRFCVGTCTSTTRQEAVVTHFSHTPVPRRFRTVPPCRLVDSRDLDGPRGGPRLAAREEREFRVAGRCEIPATARELSLNVTVTQPTAPGYLSLYPAGNPEPPTSNINFATNETRANNAIVALGDLESLTVRAGLASGFVHVILDVNGYFE
jgi:hypothetical protein